MLQTLFASVLLLRMVFVACAALRSLYGIGLTYPFICVVWCCGFVILILYICALPNVLM
jgi:hypothetical protein